MDNSMNLRFVVARVDGRAYIDSDIWVPKSSVFNSRARFAQTDASATHSWLLSASEAVSKYDKVFARHPPRLRGPATRRILYAGAAGSYYNVLFETGVTLYDIRARHRTIEVEDVQELVAELTGPQTADEACGPEPQYSLVTGSVMDASQSNEQSRRNATAVFDAASSAVTNNASQMSAQLCGFLDDSYYAARMSASTSSDDAMTMSALASAAALASPSPMNIIAAEFASSHAVSSAALVLKATATMTASKKAVASRTVTHFPGTLEIIAAAQLANISSVETQHVVIGSCFTLIEAGLCRNAMTRGNIGPECPVCLEDFDVSAEELSHSPVILQCVFPLDYAHGAMHPVCKGCWSRIRYIASMNSSQAKCPICRAVTTGRTISQCAYNVMIDLVVV